MVLIFGDVQRGHADNRQFFGKTVNRLADVSFVSASDRIEVRHYSEHFVEACSNFATIDGSLLVIRAERLDCSTTVGERSGYRH